MKHTTRSLIVPLAFMLMALVMTGCVRPAPGSEDFEPATATPSGTVPEVATLPPDLVIPQMSPTPLGEIPTPTPLPPTAEATVPPAQPQPTESAPTTGLPTTHVVQTGETLFSISQIYGVSVQEIQIANNIADPNNLTVGQTLTIPAPGTAVQPTAQPGQEQVYIVQPGDNLFRIGLRYGFTAAELAQYNGIPDMTRIYPGQVIRIPPR